MDEITRGPWRWTFIGTAGAWMLVNDQDELVRTGGAPDVPLTADQRLIAAAPDLMLALHDAQRRLNHISRIANGMHEEIYQLAYDGPARRALQLVEVPRV